MIRRLLTGRVVLRAIHYIPQNCEYRPIPNVFNIWRQPSCAPRNPSTCHCTSNRNGMSFSAKTRHIWRSPRLFLRSRISGSRSRKHTLLWIKMDLSSPRTLQKKWKHTLTVSAHAPSLFQKLNWSADFRHTAVINIAQKCTNRTTDSTTSVDVAF